MLTKWMVLIHLALWSLLLYTRGWPEGKILLGFIIDMLLQSFLEKQKYMHEKLLKRKQSYKLTEFILCKSTCESKVCATHSSFSKDKNDITQLFSVHSPDMFCF